MYTISPVYARIVLREMLGRGLSAEALLPGNLLQSGELDSGANIAMDDFVALLDKARVISGDEALGLTIGRHTNSAALGPLGGAAATAPSVREGLQVLENFARMHASYIKIELVSELRTLSVRFHFLAELGAAERLHTEAAAMFVQHYVEMITGQNLDDAANQFAFADPGYAREYQRQLHSPVSFGHPHSSVELPHHWLDRKSPYYNAEIWNQAQLLLARRMKEHSSTADNTYTSHLRAILRSLEPPLPDLGSIVASLHMSERTLNRRLREEGSSFRQIKGDVLQNWARQYLVQTDHTVEAIASALGYQDTANFRRAFRTREGCSPGEFRQRHTSWQDG